MSSSKPMSKAETPPEFEAHFAQEESIDYGEFKHHRNPELARVRRFLEWKAFQGGLWLGKTLSLEHLQQLGRQVGRVAYRLFPKERGIAQTQLQRLFPEAADMEVRVRECFEHFGQLIFEFFAIEQIASEASERLVIENEAVLHEALSQERGVILLGMHFGNWELISVYAQLSGIPMSAATTNVPDPRLNEAIRNVRERGPLKLISRGDPQATRKLLRCFQNREVFVLAIDQDTNVPSHWVPFFDMPAKTPLSAASLALRTGAPVVNYLVFREPHGRFRLCFESWGTFSRDPEQSDAQSQFNVSWALNRKMETILREHPTQWAWFHRRWRHQPNAEELEALKHLIDHATELEL